MFYTYIKYISKRPKEIAAGKGKKYKGKEKFPRQTYGGSKASSGRLHFWRFRVAHGGGLGGWMDGHI